MAVVQVLVDLGLPLIGTNPVANKWRLIDLPLVAAGREAEEIDLSDAGAAQTEPA